MLYIKTVLKNTFLFFVFGSIYYFIEICFRGYSDISMFCLSGILGCLIGGLNEYIPWDMSFVKQCLIGATIVTVAEFISGIFLNIIFGLQIWDYSNMPFNLLGQICLPFSIAWIFLSALCIVIDDYIRYWFFGEEKPRYYFKRKD